MKLANREYSFLLIFFSVWSFKVAVSRAATLSETSPGILQGTQRPYTASTTSGNDFIPPGKYSGNITVPTLKLLSANGAKKYADKVLIKDTPGWTFIDAEQRDGELSLMGQFKVAAYDACETGQNVCTVSNLSSIGGPSSLPNPFTKGELLLGSLIAFQFEPKSGDPFGDKTNYVQVINTSYSDILCQKAIGTWYTDNSCSSTIPFYWPPNFYQPYSSNASFFFDQPAAPRIDKNQFFHAEVFLSQSSEEKRVKLYDGIAWGFESSADRTKRPTKNIPSLLSQSAPSQPLAQTPPKPPCPAGMPPSSCVSFGYASVAGIISDSTLTLDEPAAAPESVPTPALLPGMIATGIYHGRKWRKRKQRNSNSDDLAA